MKIFNRLVLGASFLLFFTSCMPIQYEDYVHQSIRSISHSGISNKQQIFYNDDVYGTFPTTYNAKVEKWVNYFSTGKGKSTMERNLERSGRYKNYMQRILVDYKLPPELFYITMVESGLKAKATSHRGAGGYWQFMQKTGTSFGLQVNSLVDERHDFELSTEAAAKYLKDLYLEFGDWEISMAAYNWGEGRVRKHLKSNMDFWSLSKIRGFPSETREYIPQVIAMKMIGEHPWKYGFQSVNYQNPLEYKLIRLHENYDFDFLSSQLQVSKEELKDLNSKYKTNTVSVKQGGEAIIRVPASYSH